MVLNVEETGLLADAANLKSYFFGICLVGEIWVEIDDRQTHINNTTNVRKEVI